MKLEVVILAAGQGSRMKSKQPKVLHALAGKPLLQHVIDSADSLDADKLHVVVGHGAERVQQEIGESGINWVVQREQLGTGHAVAQAVPAISDESLVLILYGDVPLTSASTLTRLLRAADGNTLGLLTVELDDPTGYGRIVRDDAGRVQAIVEEKDAGEQQRRIAEVNTGIMAVPAERLKQWLPTLSSDNAQGEYYLTDIIAMAVQAGVAVESVAAETEWEVQGVNSRQQLAMLERWYQRTLAQGLMDAGATLADPARIDVRGRLTVGQDVFIDINTLFEGEVKIGDGVTVGANVVIRNAVIEKDAVIDANSIIEESQVGVGCQVGPFARMRPGTKLEEGAKIGNFVETKKAVVGPGSKVNHLSYVGDAELGRDVNVGAGTITCNYDGANKHRTEIGDRVFVGSNTALVAPIKIAENVTIGAGTTLSRDVEADALVLTRGKARTVPNWERPKKQ